MFKKGDKVNYRPHNQPSDKFENGIVKAVEGRTAWVVYHCDNNWDKYEDYTGASTSFDQLTPGWRQEGGALQKEFLDAYTKAAAEPLMKLLAEEYHPHCTVIVTRNRSEVVEGIFCHSTDKFLID